RSVTCRTASILNSSVYRLLLIGTSESTIFHGLEMSRKPWAYHFAESIQRELGVARIVFRVRKFSPAYQQLFQRVGAIATGRMVDGIPEWEWCFPKP
ncbi:hypothetical protein, partial [Xanthomonas campestris]|uniref:hypothetical protein n=3 Tax=Xanthomonas campestris TaxID=339 RepID=UPI001C4A65EA